MAETVVEGQAEAKPRSPHELKEAAQALIDIALQLDPNSLNGEEFGDKLHVGEKRMRGVKRRIVQVVDDEGVHSVSRGRTMILRRPMAMFTRTDRKRRDTATISATHRVHGLKTPEYGMPVLDSNLLSKEDTYSLAHDILESVHRAVDKRREH